jgi:hypothetical protein
VTKKTAAELTQGFAADGFEVKKTATYQGMRGIIAEHRTARNARTQEPKRAYYVEGSGHQMGYLIGLLAEKDVRRMTVDYVNNIIPAFISPDLTGLSRQLAFQILLHIVKAWCQAVYTAYPTDIPEPLKQEMRGVVAGCKAADSSSPVTYEDLLTLNAGVDALVAAVYTGLGLYDRIDPILDKLGSKFAFLSRYRWLIPLAKALLPKLKPEFFRVPLACNAFAAFGNATRDHKCYFGRDFQFPTAGVFQDTACLVVYNPSYNLTDGQPALPLAGQTAPGFVGSVTAMNHAGVGIGVDMLPSANCDPLRPGLNSLLMVRYAACSGYGADKAVDAVVAAQRGASWIYPVADGRNNRAMIVESGMTTDSLDYLAYPPASLKPLLPTGPFEASRRGLFVRGTDWRCPVQYRQYNERLFQKMGYRYDPAQFGERGYLNADWKSGPNQTYFFAPQREAKPDLIVVTNQALVPEMRLCAMKEWTNIVGTTKMADILWRYDELNGQCLGAYGSIDEDKARALIDFLSPKGKFKDYYGDDPAIEGSVSLCNLTDRTIASHFGYHDDDWVKLTLPRYV